MSRSITLIAALGASLALAAPAWGQSNEPQWKKALEIRSQELNRLYGLGDYSPANRALELRSEALNRRYGLGRYSGVAATKLRMLDARERAFAEKRKVQLSSGPDGVAARNTRLLDHFLANDDRAQVEPTTRPLGIPTVDDGASIEWAQIGFGIGAGMLLALGLLVGVRVARHRPLAH